MGKFSSSNGAALTAPHNLLFIRYFDDEGNYVERKVRVFCRTAEFVSHSNNLHDEPDIL